MASNQRGAFLVTWVLLGLLASVTGGFAQVSTPPLIQVRSGAAEFKLLGDNPWEPVQDGQMVAFGAVLKTGRGFEGQISYADGTTLKVKPFTMLQVLSDGLRLYRGSTWIKVVKRGRGFTCVTPSAIASVRGTSFTCEVPSIARVFGRRYQSEFFNTGHLSQGLRSHLVSVSIGLSVLGNLIAEAPGGRVPATVNVFEGKVFVVYPAHTGSIKARWLLEGGERISTVEGERATKTVLARMDYEQWGAPVPPRLLDEPSGGVGSTRETSGRSLHGRSSSESPGHPVQLMNEMYDMR